MEKIIIVKVGGHVLDNPEKLNQFLDDFASIPSDKILVHGGGKLATKIGAQLGVESRYREGRRITDAPARDLVTMVYGGLINKQLVSALQLRQCSAIGLTGADALAIQATKRKPAPIDFGYVGDTQASLVNADFLRQLLRQKITPVMAPLTYAQGEILNTNADSIAAVIAAALSPFLPDIRLAYCFEKKGVLRDVNDENSVIDKLNGDRYKKLLETGAFAEGILPKLASAFASLQAGVEEIWIGDAADLVARPHSQQGGTLIVP